MHKEIELCDTQQCTGCMSCKQACKFDAINITSKDWFAYPEIDRNKCKQCVNCVNACPIINKAGRKGNCHVDETKCLAAWNKDVNVRMQSSSGGVFSAIATKILSEGGIVFGAAWNDRMELRHIGISELSNLDSLRRSKYVQSIVGNTYLDAKQLSEQGKKVLYCGTPCQIAGLISFLGNKLYENLFTIDVLCQGVPSQELFSKYIAEIENEYGWKVVDANFRTKEHGWRCGLLLLLLLRDPKTGKKKTIRRVLGKNEYYNAFINEYFMRPSCYDCQFKNNSQGSYSDLTIADFWRIGNKIPLKVKNYTQGISAAIVNTKKGEELLKMCALDIEVIERTWKEVLTNGGFRCSIKKSNNDEALQYLASHTWHETQSKYFPMSLKKKIFNTLYLIIGEKSIRGIMKIIGRIK